MTEPLNPNYDPDLLDVYKIDPGALDTTHVSVAGYTLQSMKYDTITAAIKRNGIYDWASTAIVPQFIRVGGTVFDVGANFGYFSAWFRRLITKRGHLHAFEVHPIFYHLLISNCGRNAWKNVSVYYGAVSDRSYNDTLDLKVELPTNETLHNFGGYSLVDKNTGANSVSFVALDDYVDDNNIDRVDFIKLDVEGYENKVIAGAEYTLKTRKPVLMVELNGETDTYKELSKATADSLMSLGYRLYRIHKRPCPMLRPFSMAETVNENYLINVICTTFELPVH